MKIEIDIKGKKYTDLEINQMLCDYISIGENVYKWCQNRYMDTFYERVYNRLCTLIRKECVEDS